MPRKYEKGKERLPVVKETVKQGYTPAASQRADAFRLWWQLKFLQ